MANDSDYYSNADDNNRNHAPHHRAMRVITSDGQQPRRTRAASMMCGVALRHGRNLNHYFFFLSARG
jgi:hypothetical protein